MKVLLDTSVVVAGSLAGHVHEARAAVWLSAARSGDVTAAVTSHAFAEAWATLTSLPIEPRMPAALVDRVLDRFRSHVEVVDLSSEDYTQAMRRCSERRLRSGAIYDALHLIGAERWGADVLLTFNVGDFTRLSARPIPRIAAPPDPPTLALALP